MKLQNFSQQYASLIVFLFGALSVLGFAPFYFYPATLGALAVLIYFWQRATTVKSAAILGFFYGLGLFCVGIYWIYISLHDFGGMPALMAILATFLLCAFMALFYAGIGAAGIFICKHRKNTPPEMLSFSLILVIALLWGLADWTRSWIFTGFPWLTVGYSQVPYGPLSGFMPILGVYGVSVLTVLLAGILSLFIRRSGKQALLFRQGIAIFLCLWVGGSLLKMVAWTTSIGAPIKTALVQGNISQATKWSPETAQQTIETYLNLIGQTQAQLIVLPETAFPVLSHQLSADVQAQLHAYAQQNKGNILIGMVEFKANEIQYSDSEYFNSALSFGTNPTQIYQKSHLVPFGEFIPLKQIFGWIYRDWLNMPLSDLSRGEKFQTPMQLGTQKVAVNICYEDVFGEEIIRQLPEATLLANISNDAWYGKSFAAEQHLQFSQARALETGRMVLRATNTGATAMIDPHGMVLAHAPHDVETVLEVQAQGYTGTTPYVRFGNWPMLLIVLCSFVFLAAKKVTVQNRQNKQR